MNTVVFLQYITQLYHAALNKAKFAFKFIKLPWTEEATESGLGAIIEDDEKREQLQQDEDAKMEENIFEMRSFHSGLRQSDIDILSKLKHFSVQLIT